LPLVARSQHFVLSLARAHAEPAQFIPVFPATKAPVNPSPVHTEARSGVLDVVMLEHLAGGAPPGVPSQDKMFKSAVLQGGLVQTYTFCSNLLVLLQSSLVSHVRENKRGHGA